MLLTNTLYWDHTTHGTHQYNIPVLPRLSPACRGICWIYGYHSGGDDDAFCHIWEAWYSVWISSRMCIEQLLRTCYRTGFWELQSAEQLVLQHHHSHNKVFPVHVIETFSCISYKLWEFFKYLMLMTSQLTPCLLYNEHIKMLTLF